MSTHLVLGSRRRRIGLTVPLEDRRRGQGVKTWSIIEGGERGVTLRGVMFQFDSGASLAMKNEEAF
jgi:hypothetical protein